MYKKKKSSNLGKTRDHQAQVSFSSTSSLEAEMNQNSEANNSKANYSNKEMIEAQVDSLRLLNQVNIEMDNNYNHLMTLINHPVRIKIFGDNNLDVTGTVQSITSSDNPQVELSPARVDKVMVLSHTIPLDMIDEVITLCKPDYSAKELADLMTDTSTVMPKGPSRASSRAASRSRSRAPSKSPDRPKVTGIKQRTRSPGHVERFFSDKNPRKRDREKQEKDITIFSMESMSRELSNIDDSPARKRNPCDASLSFDILPMPVEEDKLPTSCKEIRELWIKQAIKNIKEEETRAKKNNNPHVEHHKALQWTCEEVGIIAPKRVTDELRLPHEGFLKEPEVLKNIFYRIISNPLTIWPPPKLEDNIQHGSIYIFFQRPAMMPRRVPCLGAAHSKRWSKSSFWCEKHY